MASTASAWQGRAAGLQALLARESFEVGLESQGNMDFVGFQLSKAIGADVTIPDLSSEGLTFTRAQVLRHQGEPLALISYLPTEGEPFALFAKPGKVPEAVPEQQTLAGLTTVTWSANGIAYLFAGQMSFAAEVVRTAALAREQTNGR